ncbi:hypothetical protein [Burkholderia sp. BCC0322]|uniref:hypothetical protein n=1 Tax=unclassified Burkholderia TaxID=2613784 RepID=UPI0015896AD4|nr:hypothetical protein [Burkholderia sp. BCC0322]
MHDEVKLRALLAEALTKGSQTSDERYARLPVPIRYRVTGAPDAWNAWWKVLGPQSSKLTEYLRKDSIVSLVGLFREMAVRLLPYGTPDMPPDELGMIASHCAVWQAFELRNGAIYEPTPPMHRLLDATYIADDVPIGMAKLPADAVCVIPEPSSWGRNDRSEATVLFKGIDGLGCATWTRQRKGSSAETLDVIELPLSDPDKTIGALLDEVAGESEQYSSIRTYLRQSVDYAIKMLLFLSTSAAHVRRDDAFSNAPRNFAGLGKRKRAERLLEIAHLYDRHLVGPAVLDADSIASIPTDETHRKVRGHWRRPHFKMQPHGPNFSQRKLIFVGPTIVRPDRLGMQ